MFKHVGEDGKIEASRLKRNILPVELFKQGMRNLPVIRHTYRTLRDIYSRKSLPKPYHRESLEHRTVSATNFQNLLVRECSAEFDDILRLVYRSQSAPFRKIILHGVIVGVIISEMLSHS